MERTFSFKMSDRLIIANDALYSLPEIVKRLNARKPLIVTDPGLVKAGILDKVTKILTDAAIPVAVYSQVEADPRIEIVFDVAKINREEKCDIVIGIGGGSSLDIAKVVSVLGSDPDDKLYDFIGVDNIDRPGLPTIMIPTTAGTGSEVTPIAVLSDKKEQLKKGIVSDFLYPTVALIDPLLTLTLPPAVTAYTGVDALTHAIEAYTNRHAHPFVDTFALEAIALISKHLPIAVSEPENKESRYAMALGSLYGGLCLGSVNTAAVHALAYPLGGMYDVPHGVANSLLLPYVIEFNQSHAAPRYAIIAEKMGGNIHGMNEDQATQLCIELVKSLCKQVGIVDRIRDLDIPESAIDIMAEGAIKVTRLLNNNPKEVKFEDARNIYQNAY